MKILNHHIDEDGTLSFLVPREIYSRVQEHLRSKGFTVGGTEHFDNDGQSEVRINATFEQAKAAVADFEENPRHSEIKTIQENGLDAVHLAIQHVDPVVLAPMLRRIIGEGKFTDAPFGIGKTVYRTFTPASPIPADFAQEVANALEAFSQTETGRAARFDGMTMEGVKMFWRAFIS